MCSMSNSIQYSRSLALSVCFLLCGVAGAQNPGTEPAPDYRDAGITATAEDAMKSWLAWQRGDRDLEKEVLKASMSDARDRIQRSFSALLAYLEKRKKYSESVASYIEHYRPETAGGKPIVTVETVNREQLGTCNAIIANLQGRIDGLRDSPEWARIRRSVTADTTAIAGIQSARRSELPIELPFSNPEPPRQLSVIVYRDSERQLREAVQSLWTHYYQALDDAAEQRPGGTPSLVASVTPPAVGAPTPVADPSTGSAGPPAPPATAGIARTPPAASAAIAPAPAMLVGTWRYIERSQQFNGVEEPHQVLLEIWMEKSGTLSARYRGILTDLDGPHELDLALHQVPGSKNSKEVTLHYKLADQDAEGQFTIEGPGASGIDLTVAHGGHGVPKGREIVVRR